MFSHYTRVFGFARQVFATAMKKPTLFAPLVMNILLAVPVHALLIVASMFVSDSIAMLLMPVGLSALYFIDYFAGGLNTAMVYEEMTSGNATLGAAFKRTLKSAVGIVVFAVVSGLLDFAVQLLSSRRAAILRPILMIVRSFWSTATFVIMPSMIIEELGFAASFKRSKELAENDPTQIGVGYIGIGVVTSLISMVGFLVVSFVGVRVLMPISPLLSIGFSLFVINATWAIAAYLKSTYYTCFYMWTRECERHKGVNPAFAPAPLRNVLADVDFGALGVQLAPAGAAAAGAGFAAAPAQGGFAAAPAQSAPAQGGFAAPPAQGGFAAAPAQGGFTAPPAQSGFGAPPTPSYTQPQQQQAYAQPQQAYAQPQQAYAQPQQQAYAQPQQQAYAQPQQQAYAQPQQQAYAQPQQQAYAQPQQAQAIRVRRGAESLGCGDIL